MFMIPLLIGLGVAMLIFNLDELFFDVSYFVYGRRQRSRLQISQLYTTAHRRIAIMIPAYQEGAVIGHMLRSALSLINYPLSRYHIFVGVYPNDPETQAAVDEVAEQFPNVHKIVGPDPGPTTKASNLNYVWRRLQEMEAETGGRFEIILMHDAEDLIHPLSLKLYNYLADRADMVQIPVLPVLPPPTLRNFFKNLTMGTYADEFAENHLRHMLVRERIGGFVPSAGVGTALSRRAIELLAAERDGNPFDTRALTEDYVMSLRLARGGMRTLYFLEGIQRVAADGRPHVEYIATREVFPNDYAAAIRQKTRWIYGITMQSRLFRRADDQRRSPGQRYLLFHDLKGKFSNLLAPFVFIVPFLLLFMPTLNDLMTPEHERILAALLVANLALSIERQFARALALAQYYGWRHALLAVLLPPLFPIRFVWGSLINFVATMKAWRLHLFGSPARKRRWAKTEHHWYMPPDLLASSQRRLGDILLERGDLSPRLLRRALRRQARTGQRLGDILVDYHYISEEQLRSALAALNQTWYLDSSVGRWNPEMRHVLPEVLARSLKVAPLLALANELVVVTAEPLPTSVFALLKRGPGDRIWQVLAPPDTVAAGLEAVYSGPDQKQPRLRLGTRLVLDGVITMPELVDALQEQVYTGQRLGETLVQLGYVPERVLQQYVDAEPAAQTAS